MESLQRFGWRFGLATVRALLHELGDPHRGLCAVHVAGTNGKGAVCAYTASILKAAGWKTGLYTSPHLCSPRERFRIDGAWIPAGDYERLSGLVLKACARLSRRGLRPTYFEAQTALAFLWFRERRVDVAVLETGLGGRLDATNVVADPAVILLTPVGLEHRDILGKTLEHIAAEKAGILKRGCFAVTARQDPRVLAVLRAKARKEGAFLSVAGEDLEAEIPLPPRRPAFDAGNAALAAAGARLLSNRGIPVGEVFIRRGIRSMRWPGRFEILSSTPPVLLDGAHNPAAFRALAASLRSGFPGRRWILLNGFLGDKDFASCVRAMRDLVILSVVTLPPSDRKADGVRVVRAWESEGVRTLYVPDWRQALALSGMKAGKREGLLVAGSLYLVGACRGRRVGMKGLSRI